MFRDTRVLIAGLDPRIGGGVPAMMAATARNLTALGADVEIIHLSIKRESHSAAESFLWNGYPCHGVSYLRSPNTFTNYLAPARKARQFIAGFDQLFVVGASQAGVLFWSDGRAYTSWLATTVSDEWRSRSWRTEIRDRHWGWMLDRAAGPVTRAFDRAVVRRSSRVYALSRSTQQSIAVECGGNPVYLPYPVDTERFFPAAPTKDPVVVYVGRLDDRRKNVPLLLQAFSKVHARIPTAELWLVGSYSAEGIASRIIHDLKLTSSVRLLGYQPDERLPGLYREAAVFALPSLQEGLGIVVLEAMAAGVPVVSTLCGGPEDDVRESRAGRLVRHDPDAFADALTEILENPDLRGDMSRRAVEFVRGAHSDDVFQRTLAKP